MNGLIYREKPPQSAAPHFPDDPRKPAAWNLELGVSLLDNVELAIGYGGSDDGGTEFLPESQYGVVANWGVFDNTNLALEYLKTEFEDNAGEIDTITMQLAIEF